MTAFQSREVQVAVEQQEMMPEEQTEEQKVEVTRWEEKTLHH